ncbi:MAG TPA: M28 family metallopeptidase [Terriglobales bacterium]|nr:M28 family metallopeptidase [Terriglobales bacterium]
MRRRATAVLILTTASLLIGAGEERDRAQAARPKASTPAITGFHDAAQEEKWEKLFLAVPDPKQAEEHLSILTAAPHMAGTPEDKKTADYVARQFQQDGLQAEIVEYKVWMNYPREISVDVVAPLGVTMHGPTREHVTDDRFQDDPRVVTPFNEYSPSGDVEADVVYANYARPEDFNKLKAMGVDVRGKIVIARYGQNFRGVKAYIAQEHGAAALIIYSDPMDDGYFKGEAYPQGPWRPSTGVQRGSIGYMFEFAGDPTTPGLASVAALPDSQRIPPEKSAALPRIPTTPLSYHDAEPILAHLAGPVSPRDWQGALPFTYHLGPGPVRVRLHLQQDYQYRTVWDVIGTIPGTQQPAQWVVAGNHRDAWVYGAVDPNSGTTALLEAARGLGELLHAGWKPKRTIVLGSWDGEEQGLIGSTEWAEQHASELANAAAYLNVDVAVSGENFGASAVPSLKQFIREVAMAVPSPKGGTVYDAWRKAPEKRTGPTQEPSSSALSGSQNRPPEVEGSGPPVGDLGSGSDYTAFLQHLGVPSVDIGSSGPYGVYHSTFDDFEYFRKFTDPTFVYEQEMARVYGLEVVRLAGADVLPYDYAEYGKEIQAYLKAAQAKAEARFGKDALDFAPAFAAAARLQAAGTAIHKVQKNAQNREAELNQVLLGVERAFLLPRGLPNRPWYRHAIYAPGVYTGYAAVVIPGVNEALDAGDRQRARQELIELADAVNLAAKMLQNFR